MAVQLHRVNDGVEASWILFAEPHVRVLVNGSRVWLGLAALTDRDEIRLPDGSVRYFSTEALARVEPYTPATPGGRCPRCRQPIQPNTDAVRCPGCALWHHASADMPCWTYEPRCASCEQSTHLDAGFRWTPEDL